MKSDWRYAIGTILVVMCCEMQPVPKLPDTHDWIAFCRREKEDNAKSDIWLINIQTRQEIRVTNTSRYYEEAPVWLSPSKLVYMIEPQPESYSELNLVIANLNSGKQRLLDYWTWRNCPSYNISVDTHGNIFYSLVDGKTIELLMPSTEREEYSIKGILSPERVAEFGLVWVHTPSVFPDGNELLFSACDTQKYRRMHIGKKKPYFDIYNYSIREHVLKRMTFGDASNGYASLIGSDSISFSSNRDGNWELYLMNRDGKMLRRLTYTDSINEWQGATISPDHSLICYAGYNLKTEDEEMWIMDLKTGKIEYVTKGYSPAWAPFP